MSLKAKNVEIFSGTGGVGKTTLATARANYLAQQGRSVLLITIDPAKRLKEILGLTDDDQGKVLTIKNLTTFERDYSFSAELMSPESTFASLTQEVPGVFKNRILKILTKPYGGMNEILSLVELQKQIDSNLYQTIILDTPPGAHFLDFLEGTGKIRAFFDQTFIDIFDYFNKRNTAKVSILSSIVSTGIKKLLDYLQKVTGATFVQEFMEAVGLVYKTKETFLRALQLQQNLKEIYYSNWFLVTSVDQNKVREALELQGHAKHFIHEDNYVILNKVQEKLWEEWATENESERKLKDTFINREKNLKLQMKKFFQNILEFNEVLALSPRDHVFGLTENWKGIDHDLNKH